MLTEFQTKVKQAVQLGCECVVYDDGADITDLDFTGPNGLDLIFNLNRLKMLTITKNITNGFNGIYLCINDIILSGNITNSFTNTILDFRNIELKTGSLSTSFLKNIMTGCEFKITNPSITSSFNEEVFNIETITISITTSLTSSFATVSSRGTTFLLTYTGTSEITNTFLNVNLIEYCLVDFKLTTATTLTTSFNLLNIESNDIMFDGNVIGNFFAYSSIVGTELNFKNTSTNTSGIIFNNSTIVLKNNFIIDVNNTGDFLKNSVITVNHIIINGGFVTLCDFTTLTAATLYFDGSITTSLLSQTVLNMKSMTLKLGGSTVISIMQNSKIAIDFVVFESGISIGSNLFQNSKLLGKELIFKHGLIYETIWTNCILNINELISEGNFITSASDGVFIIKDKIMIHGDLTISFNNSVVMTKNIFTNNIINSFQNSTVKSKLFVVNGQLDSSPNTKFFIDRLKLKSYISDSGVVYTNLGYLDLNITVTGNEYIELIESAQFGRTIVYLIVNENTIGVFSQGQFIALCELVLTGTASVMEVPLEILAQINKIEIHHELNCEEEKRLEKYCLKNSWKKC